MIANSIRQRIRGKGRGAVFTPGDFLDIGSRDVVDKTLSRLADQGMIRRLTRGVYDFPQTLSRFGQLSPDLDAVAAALARANQNVLQVSPAFAANQLGLTTQMPANRVYLTDGSTRTKQVGNQKIQLRHANAKTLVGAGQATGMVFQALRYVGKDGVSDQVIRKLRRALSADDKARLVRQSMQVPAWMQPIAKRIAEAA